MKLLIITQKVDSNDPILGFFHRWIEEFSLHYESVLIICLEKGVFDLPENVKIFSLGKEYYHSRVFYLINFFKLIISNRHCYDKIFVHMNPVYVVLAGWLWNFILQKEIFMWYTHKSVDWKLYLAEKFAVKIFTASMESFRLNSKKVLAIGHGIDINFFKPLNKNVNYDTKSKELFLLSISRISETKKIHILISALEKLHISGIFAQLTIIGGPITKIDQIYENNLKNQISDYLSKYILWVGPLSNKNILNHIQSSDIFIHASDTGSLDKSILEAMACEKITISSNDAAESILKPIDPHLVFRNGDSDNLAENIKYFYNRSDNFELKNNLRNVVVSHHSLAKLIDTIVREIN